MARGLGTTYGSGTTDRIVTTLSTDSTTRSWFIWVLRHGAGGSGAGMILRQGLVASGPVMAVYNGGTTYVFYRSWSTVYGQWTTPIPSIDVWHSFGIVYNGSSTANYPAFYLDGTKLAPTRTSAPSGTLSSLSGVPVAIGGASDNTGYNWDGKVADCAIWNGALTDNEFFALAKGVRPYTIRTQALAGYWPLDGLSSPEPDLSGSANSGTLTGTLFASGAPNMLFTRNWPINQPRPILLAQKHFRFRTDTDAVDATPTWGAAEDVGQ